MPWGGLRESTQMPHPAPALPQAKKNDKKTVQKNDKKTVKKTTKKRSKKNDKKTPWGFFLQLSIYVYIYIYNIYAKSQAY